MRLIIRCLPSLWRHCGRSKYTLCILEVQTKTIKNDPEEKYFFILEKNTFSFLKILKILKIFKKKLKFWKSWKNQTFQKSEISDFFVNIFSFSIFEKKNMIFKILKIYFFSKNRKLFFSKMKKHFSSGFFFMIRYVPLLHRGNI